MELVLDFLREGTDIILSDTDAIWRRNPFPDLAKYAFKSVKMSPRDSDIEAATASTIIPPSDIVAVCILMTQEIMALDSTHNPCAASL